MFSSLILVSSLMIPLINTQNERFNTGRVKCFTCDVDFTSEPYDKNHTCLVGKSNQDLAQCSLNSKYCKVEVGRLNSILVSFSRKCSLKCIHDCNRKGFGLDKETCTYCCTNNPSCQEDRTKINHLYGISNE